MKNLDELFNSLSIFEGATLTNKQLEHVLASCKCPKNFFFQKHFKNAFVKKFDKLNVVVGLDKNIFNKVWDMYCIDNRASVKKASIKRQIRKKTDERMARINYVFYSKNYGPLTLEREV